MSPRCDVRRCFDVISLLGIIKYILTRDPANIVNEFLDPNFSDTIYGPAHEIFCIYRIGE